MLQVIYSVGALSACMHVKKVNLAVVVTETTTQHQHKQIARPSHKIASDGVH